MHTHNTFPSRPEVLVKSWHPQPTAAAQFARICELKPTAAALAIVALARHGSLRPPKCYHAPLDWSLTVAAQAYKPIIPKAQHRVGVEEAQQLRAKTA